MSDLLFRFNEHLRVLGRSEATVKAYGWQLRRFLEAFEGRDVKTVNRKAIEDYLASLSRHQTRQGAPYRPGTLALRVRSIKRFFEFLERANLIFINPAEWVPEPRIPKRLPREVLSREEAVKILDQPNLSTLTGIRDRALLELLYSTGIRIGELTALGIFDLDLAGAMVRVIRGKGKKDRVVPLGKHAVRFLREYLAKVRPHFTRKNRSERRLWMDTYGKPLSKAMISILIRTYARAAGIGKKITAHSFRHGFATELVRNGADLAAVQKMLGHSDISVTQIYIRTAGIDLKSAHQKSHPREKDRLETGSAKPGIERTRPKREPK